VCALHPPEATAFTIHNDGTTFSALYREWSQDGEHAGNIPSAEDQDQELKHKSEAESPGVCIE